MDYSVECAKDFDAVIHQEQKIKIDLDLFREVFNINDNGILFWVQVGKMRDNNNYHMLLYFLNINYGDIVPSPLYTRYNNNDIVFAIVAKDNHGVLKYSKGGFGWSAYLETWDYYEGYKKIYVKVCDTIEELIEQIYYTKGYRIKLPSKLERKLKLDEIENR